MRYSYSTYGHDTCSRKSATPRGGPSVSTWTQYELGILAQEVSDTLVGGMSRQVWLWLETALRDPQTDGCFIHLFLELIRQPSTVQCSFHYVNGGSLKQMLQGLKKVLWSTYANQVSAVAK
ncbi:hypothetical protein F9C07_5827 [Aspergillus flavus]|uniref:Uncharacterized protein n=1 Tax=Aspergillus flavus (strain ATCC 200026 / FGSC A1120 / IAM 13836 / NRRL 3357 / JCM 12722 / SRRC 167) TaxID=332952 RepID=A0A7U2MXN0_ASPFN|nr:hypothetical protein F9C07_5827 [Aspergillus flavus]